MTPDPDRRAVPARASERQWLLNLADEYDAIVRNARSSPDGHPDRMVIPDSVMGYAAAARDLRIRAAELAAQPPSPAPGAAEVLAGLVHGLDSWYLDPIALTDKVYGLDEARQLLRSLGLFSGLKPVEAAQQRLAERDGGRERG